MRKLVLASVLPAAAAAAQQFAPPPIPQLPGVIRASAPIDLDGDGRDDVVVRDPGGASLSVFLNSGAGVFAATAPVAAVGNLWLRTGRAAVVDLEGDGDQDLVLQNSSVGGIRLILLRNTAGVLAEVVPPPPLLPGGTLNTVVQIDVDGDGDGDLLTASSGQLNLLRNDGTGVFTVAATLPPLTFPRGIAAGDFDRDGRADLAIGFGAGMQVWMGRGGALVDESAARVPVGLAGPYDLAAFDHDGDGDLDLVGSNLVATAPFAILDNDGTGRFVLPPARLPAGLPASPASVLVFEADGDGRPDLLLGNQILRQQGGAFAVAGSIAGALQVCDLDGDALDDLVLGEGFARNLGARGFERLIHCPGTMAADLDRDGDVDLVGRSVWRNEGGRLVAEQLLTPAPASAALGDLDGDGDIDLASRGDGIALWTNDGTGALSLAFTIPVARAQRGIAVLDADRDGDLDFAFGGFIFPVGTPPGLHQNLGALNFGDVSATALPSGLPLYLTTVVAGDADADGDPDLLYGYAPQAPAAPMALLLLNRGDGTFAAAGSAFAPPVGAGPAVFAQVDPDPELEIVVADDPDLRLFDRVAGVWSETSGRLPATVTPASSVVPVDFDADGDADLVVGTGGFLLRNDGSGRFVDVTATYGPATATPIGAVDLDGDGDQDLIDGGRVLLNQTRQLWPRSPWRGGSAALLAFVGNGGSRNGVATALIGANVLHATAPQPLFGGTLLVEPSGAVLLGAVTSVNGQPTSWSLPIPASPLLRGVDVHLQGAVVDHGTLALLNHVHAVIE